MRNIWFVTSRTASNGVADVASVQTIGLATVVRPELGTTACLQLVLYGRKDYLDNIFVEYDEDVTSKRRLLYKTENDANGEVNEIGWVSDYNETILPLVGVAKPKDFSLVKRPEGFNGDTDIVVSKGRTAGGQTPYSGLFNLSYFNPVFFTKLLVDSNVTSDFAPGKYITGSQSGAYGVVEGLSLIHI